MQSAIVVTILAASSAPTPLYPGYESRWSIADIDISLAFSGYPVGLLVALLFFGSLSDHLGRRPVVIFALSGLMASMLIIFGAPGVEWLVLGRTLQGLSTGVALGAVGAFLVELAPPGRPGIPSLVNSAGAVIGTAVGALLGGVAILLFPRMPEVVFLVLLSLFGLELLGAALSPETWRRAPGIWRSMIPSVYIPPSLRRTAGWTLAAIFLAWAVSSITLSFGPVLVTELTGGESGFLGGVIVVTMCVPGGVATFALSGRSATTILLVTAGSLIPGAAAIVFGISSGIVPLYFVGTAVAGLGVGTSLLGALRMLTPAAPPDRRAGVISAVYVAAYVGLTLPTIVVGALAEATGLRLAFLVFDLALGVAAAATLIGLTVVARRDRSPRYSRLERETA